MKILAQYFVLINRNVKNSLVIFLATLCFVAMTSRRDITCRNNLACQTIKFLGLYRKLRSENGSMQEIYYNFGRSFHQLGIPNLAVYWYSKVLEEPNMQVFEDDPLTGDGKLVDSTKYDLKRLAALNLANIIKNENPLKARDLKRKYCVLR